jgi:hypothetical protein
MVDELDRPVEELLTPVRHSPNGHPQRPGRRSLRRELGAPLGSTDPADWLFPAHIQETDFQGKTQTITMKVPADLADAAAALIGQPGIPYGSVKHIANDGIYVIVQHANERLKHPDPRIRAIINAEELAREGRLLRARIEQFALTIATLEDNLTTLVSMRLFDEAQRALDAHFALVGRNPDDFWRERTLDAIDALPIVQILNLLEEASRGTSDPA